MTPELLEKPRELHKDADATQLDRRALLIGAGVVAAGAIGYPLIASAFGAESPVFLAKNQRYDSSLERTIRDGLRATGIDLAVLAGKRVLLKPNMVEPSRARPQMTTHPAVIVAAAEVFRRHGATVTVGEAPGHVRDTQMALYESSVGAALEDAGVEFADLNYEDVAWKPNAGRTSPLAGFYLPSSVASADLIVSLPKLKTHHWVGMTAAMKNLYGVLPGIKYGWPKNVLHHAGIPQTVFDINASLPPVIAIVDGILCMEGDGPILGSPKPMGLIAVGAPVSVDATCARIIGLQPQRMEYLRLGRRLGPIDEGHIPERGEAWRDLASPFQIIDEPSLQRLRRKDAIVTS